MRWVIWKRIGCSREVSKKLLLKATLFQGTYKTPQTDSLYTAETTGAAIQIAKGANSGSGEVWPGERATECKHRRPLQSTGGNCIISCRKATKASQKQIKEDVSKHQRKACSTALESFRGNNPERVAGKSLLCFPSVFRETGFSMLASTVLPRREEKVRDRQAVRTQHQAWGRSFSL